MKRTAIVFFFLILAIVVLADMGRLGPLKRVYDIPYGDKAGHFILFGLLNYFVTRAVLESQKPSNPKRVAVVVAILIALLIAIEEFTQLLFPKRTFELLDLLAGYIGVAIGGWAGWKMFQKNKKAQSA